MLMEMTTMLLMKVKMVLEESETAIEIGVERVLFMKLNLKMMI